MSEQQAIRKSAAIESLRSFDEVLDYLAAIEQTLEQVKLEETNKMWNDVHASHTRLCRYRDRLARMIHDGELD